MVLEYLTMCAKKQYRLEDYFDPTVSLNDHIQGLSDTSEFPDPTAEKTNAAVLALVTKYSLDYLGITSGSMTEIQLDLDAALAPLALEFNDQFEHVKKKGNLDSFTSDGFAVNCLTDLRATAAVFKEIALNEKFEKKDAFLGMDFGSGSGILSAAMAVSALRSGARKSIIVMLELLPRAVERSSRTVHSIGDIDWNTHRLNICEEGLYQRFGPYGPFLSHCVSETINSNTREVASLSPTNVQWKEGKHRGGGGNWIDPYEHVLQHLLKHFVGFYDRVRTGKTAFFPDIINGKLIPAQQGHRSAKLSLDTAPSAKHIPLRKVGSEFDAFQVFESGMKRWID